MPLAGVEDVSAHGCSRQPVLRPFHGPVFAQDVLDGCLLLLAEGSLEPITLQDRMDRARIERERHAPTFSVSFWALRHSDLVNAGFNAKVASTLIADIRSRVETEEGAEPCLA